MDNTSILIVGILLCVTLTFSFSEKESFTPFVPSPNPTTGELVLPSFGGIILNSNNYNQAIRLTGSVNPITNDISGNGTSNSEIQFFIGGNIKSAYDISGLYMVDGNSIFLGTSTNYLQFNHVNNVSSITYTDVLKFNNATTLSLSLDGSGNMIHNGSFINNGNISINGSVSYTNTLNFNNTTSLSLSLDTSGNMIHNGNITNNGNMTNSGNMTNNGNITNVGNIINNGIGTFSGGIYTSASSYNFTNTLYSNLLSINSIGQICGAKTFSFYITGNGAFQSQYTINTYLNAGGLFMVKLSGAGSANFHAGLVYVGDGNYLGSSILVMSLGSNVSGSNYSSMFGVSNNYFIWNSSSLPNNGPWTVNGVAYQIF